MHSGKTVYSFGPDGAFTGPIELDDSDLSPLEEGVYLIPGNCLELAPPEFDPSSHRAVARDGAWDIEPIALPTTAPTPEALRAALKAQATAKRWSVEVGGITLPNGITVSTGTADQDRITSVIVNAGLAGIDTVDFKADSGWITASLDELKQIAKAIALHVQACFTAERAHHEAIDALADDALDTYDINTGWPA